MKRLVGPAVAPGFLRWMAVEAVPSVLSGADKGPMNLRGA